ncbi:hypothetical protein HP1_080 [Candidatus Termititenax spirochaetophilus]|uniref:Uncharacterized protein n=1 Tax=Candidatus Termititenax spirochaetophilus TaxID=2218522 RepID=A0A388T9S8_9BACT|nr:hypothetical protein HP1_080 [Candidatus Termititenax spirochaetophilus]
MTRGQGFLEEVLEVTFRLDDVGQLLGAVKIADQEIIYTNTDDLRKLRNCTNNNARSIDYLLKIYRPDHNKYKSSAILRSLYGSAGIPIINSLRKL